MLKLQWLTCLLLVCCFNSAFAQSDLAPREVIESLEKSQAELRAAIEFTATYEVFQWTVPTIPAQLSELEPPPGSQFGQGLYHKRDGVTRIQFVPVSSRLFPPADQLLNSSVLAEFTTEPQGVIRVQSRRDTTKGELKNGTAGYDDHHNPLNLLGNARRQWFRFAEIPKARETEEVIKADATHLTVVTRQATGPVTFVMETALWTEPEKPVIESCRARVEEQGKVVQQFIAQAWQFRKCPGGWMARSACLVSTGSQNQTVRLWRSRDLGERPPQDTDFEISVPAKTELMGLYKIGTNSAGAAVLSPRDLVPSNVVPEGTIIFNPI